MLTSLGWLAASAAGSNTALGLVSGPGLLPLTAPLAPARERTSSLGGRVTAWSPGVEDAQDASLAEGAVRSRAAQPVSGGEIAKKTQDTGP